jgi:hypothetical protein
VSRILDRRYRWFLIGTFLTIGALIVLHGQTPAFNAMVTLDSNGYLNVSASGAGTGQGPATPMGNTLVKTDSSNYLLVNCQSGCGGGGAGNPAGSDTQMQFNSGGNFGASANLTWVSPALSIGAASSATGQLKMVGTTSGTVTIQSQAAAGTYNFNLPTSAGSSGLPLVSGGGGASAQTYSALATAAISDNAITLAKMATQGSGTILANVTIGTAVPTASTLSDVLDAMAGSTEHDLLLRGASTWGVSALPNCPDSGGNHLNYTQSGHSFSCGTSGGAGGGVAVHGTPTANHAAIWYDATTIQDGGVFPSFTPTGGIDEMIYYQGSGDDAFHPVTLSNGITLTAGALGISGSLTLTNGSSLQTSTSAGNTLNLRAYDVDGASYTTFATLTANNTPTLDLAAAVTINGAAITSLSNTQVFTNKTYDTEATGNVFTIPMLYQFTAAGCQNTTASVAFDTPTTLGATATCQSAAAGGHAVLGTAKFIHTEVDEVQGHFKLPADWSGAIDVTLDWNAVGTTTNNAVWQIKFGCVADAEAPSTASFNNTAFAAVANKGTTLQLNHSTKTGITTTGCSTSETAWFIIYWDDAATGNTLVDTDLQLIDAIFTIRRAI